MATFTATDRLLSSMRSLKVEGSTRNMSMDLWRDFFVICGAEAMSLAGWNGRKEFARFEVRNDFM